MSAGDRILNDLLGPEPDWGPVHHCFNCGRITESRRVDGRWICLACVEVDRKAHDLFDAQMVGGSND